MTSFPTFPTFSSVRKWYAEGGDPESGLTSLSRRISRDSAPGIWISLLDESAIRERVRFLKKIASTLSPDEQQRRFPLFCIPFAVKDNMDVAGMETTAACPAYAYTAEKNAFVIQRILDAGAVLMGKTNMDQFATGLVGTRSPYGACPNSFSSEYISGGSSSGSAHAVAKGYVSFSLGTDTAGSGRVPAALNNLVGLKPSRGLLSTRGVVPACPSLDCVSIFALTCEDAEEVFSTASFPDEEDIWSRTPPSSPATSPERFTFGVPSALNFCGNMAWEHAYKEAVDHLISMGGTPVTVDYAPYREAADMLYFGPYLAERMAAVGNFVESHPECCDSTVKKIICGASHWTAVDAFNTACRTMEIKKIIGRDFQQMDMLLLPTAPTTYRIEEVRRDPVRTNVTMGSYTNFVNILDLCAIAVPSSIPKLPGTDVSMPFGITMIAPAFSEKRLLSLASRFHADVLKEGIGLGASISLHARHEEETMLLAVCGAHMSGLSLSSQMEEAGATLAFSGRTAPCYRMKIVPESTPCRPALIRVREGGCSLAVEVWDMPRAAVGDFLKKIPAPLGLGSVQLNDGSWVTGFICESALLQDAMDISEYGSFRTFLEKKG